MTDDADGSDPIEDRGIAELAFMFLVVWIVLVVLAFRIVPGFHITIVMFVPILAALLASGIVYGVLVLEERRRGGDADQEAGEAGEAVRSDQD